MAVSKTEGRKTSDVLEWVVHETFCFETVQMNNGDVALAINANLCGKIAFYVSAGVYKILDTGDSITGTSDLAVILSNKVTQVVGTADLANLMPKCVILVRGPAVINVEELSFGGTVEATVKAALLAKNIVQVQEAGALYANF